MVPEPIKFWHGLTEVEISGIQVIGSPKVGASGGKKCISASYAGRKTEDIVCEIVLFRNSRIHWKRSA